MAAPIIPQLNARMGLKNVRRYALSSERFDARRAVELGLVDEVDLRVEAREGVVRLEGAVRSFFHKQMAQETIRRLDGVERIENCLQVEW